MRRSPSWEATVPPLFKKFSAFSGTRRFINLLPIAHPLSVSRDWWIQCTSSQLISVIFILMLPRHLRLYFCLVSTSFQIEALSIFSPIRATCSIHRVLIDLIIRIVFSEGYKTRMSSAFLTSCCYSFPPRPKYLSQHPLLEHTQPMFFT